MRYKELYTVFSFYSADYDFNNNPINHNQLDSEKIEFWILFIPLFTYFFV